MNKLTIEQKAKAYDEAVINASRLWECGEITRENYEYIFPELAESGDERIRKALISFLKSPFVNENITDEKVTPWIAWLEKQGEQKPTEWHREDEQNLNACLGYIPDEFLRRWLTNVIHTKYDKPTDKVEPKFKVGDWVMLDRPVLITKVENMPYNTHEYWTSAGTWFGDATKAKLWTIQDAKDGDVLYFISNSGIEYIAMNKGINRCNNVDSYFRYNSMDGFAVDIPSVFSANDSITPATKEQRDLLFQKMKEAGYKWDAEKKELKKISQEYPLTPDECIKSSWSGDDEKYLKLAIENFQTLGNSFLTSWIKSLKDRVQPQSNQEWSEEDERIKNNLLSELTNLSVRKLIEKETEKKYANWLKSLRLQSTWKPSDEMLEALYRVIPENTMEISEDEMLLDKLYQGLKYGKVLNEK